MRLSKHQYLEKFGHLRKGGWARKKNLRASMVSHILARPHDQLGRTAIQVNWAQQAEGHLSPWISATSNIDYALWDISNRLAKGEDTIKLAVIKQSKGADSGGWEWRERGKTRSIRGAEVWTMACGEIQEERKHAPYWDKMHWDRAHRRALACGEVLYFGRIFGESVVADLIFTRDSLPFALPGHLLRPDIESGRVDPLRGWLSITRWDAPYTDWAQTRRRIGSQVSGGPITCPAIYIANQTPDAPPAYEAALESPVKHVSSHETKQDADVSVLYRHNRPGRYPLADGTAQIGSGRDERLQGSHRHTRGYIF